MATLLFLTSVDIFPCCHPPTKKNKLSNSCLSLRHKEITSDYFHNLSNDWILPAEYCHLFFHLLTKVSVHFSTSQFLSSCIIFFSYHLVFVSKRKVVDENYQWQRTQIYILILKGKKSSDHRHLLKFANHSASYNTLNSHPYLTLGVIFLLTPMCSAKITET